MLRNGSKPPAAGKMLPARAKIKLVVRGKAQPKQ
jgi:hypothetical protein